MRGNLLGTAVILCAALGAVGPTASSANGAEAGAADGVKAKRPPNFVLINIDDLGYADIGPFGGTVPTPHLDRMANEGMRLTSHYGAPVCSPSRAALMTGCYPKRVLPTEHVLFPVAAVGLSPDEVTVAEVLKSVGYSTACIGKWHLGDQPEFLPTRQGFDSYYGIPYSNDMGLASEGSKSNLGAPLPKPQPVKGGGPVDETGLRGNAQPALPLLENEKVVARVDAAGQQKFTRDYTDRAISFIEKNKELPFFLYLPHNAVHWPHYPAQEFVGKSKSTLLADWIMEMDAEVGRVLDAIRRAGIADDTLVIFTSDNGGSVPLGSSNKPLRGSKGSTLEGGIRVCTLAWWPKHVPASTKTKAMTTMMDILPTFAALAGAKLDPARKIDGIDVRGVLQGKNASTVNGSDHQQMGAPRGEFHYFRGMKLEAVRRGPWKLHLEKEELYNVDADVGEAKNIAAEQPQIVEDLRAMATAMDADLGIKGRGPGVRPLGRVENAKPLIAE
jgi:arylsulfatase A